MQLVKRIIAELMASLEERAQRCLLKLMLRLLLISMVALLMAGGGVFAVIALYLYLTQILEAWLAALLTGGALLVLSGLLLLLGVRSHTSPAGEQPNRDSAETHGGSHGDTAAQLGEMAGEKLSRSNLRATDAAMIALAAGIAIGLGGRRRRKSPEQEDEPRA